MKHGMTLEEMKDEIIRRAVSKKDYTAPRKVLQVVPADDGELKLNIGTQAQVAINDVAHSQFSSVLQIPKQYYDRCRREYPELVAANVNKWLQNEPEKMQLVRTLDDTARALVSDKFRTDMEYETVAVACLPVLDQMDVEVHSCEITEKKMYIKCVDKRVTRELEKVGARFGDGGHSIVRVAAPAITIANSEVGFGAFSILAGVYDHWCSNLATFSERSMRKYHVGARHDVAQSYATLLSDDTRKLTNDALVAQVQDVVKGAFNEAKFNELVDEIEGKVDNKITGDPVECVNLTGKALGVNQEESKAVLRHLIEGGDLSQFGLYNAVTRMSQDVESYDRATELEEAGGKIINLKPSEWQAFAEAA